MSMFQDIISNKTVMLVGIVVLSIYLLYTIYTASFQRHLASVMQTYVENQPPNMCVNQMELSHNIFPPKFGVTSTYIPCVRGVVDEQ